MRWSLHMQRLVNRDSGLIPDVVRAAEMGMSVKYGIICATSLLIYDIIITLDEEVNLVWRSKRSLPKYLYFVSRYFGLFIQLTYMFNILPLRCEDYLLYSFLATAIMVTSAEFCLMLRVHALWNGNKFVLALVFFGYFCEMITASVLFGLAYPIIHDQLATGTNGSTTAGCPIVEPPPFYHATWIPLLSFETLLFLLSVIKCLSLRPNDNNLNVPVVMRLIRDGTVYFGIVCGYLMVGTVSEYLSGVVVVNIISLTLPAVLSFSATRLLLSIRALAGEEDIQTFDISANLPSFRSPDDPLDCVVELELDDLSQPSGHSSRTLHK